MTDVMPAAVPHLAYTRTQTLLVVDHVSLAFGERLILRDVCAEVKEVQRPDGGKGQVICFLGPSGIGKTQLSRIIAGLQAPTHGEVRVSLPDYCLTPAVRGKPGVVMGPVCKGLVGMVPQNYPLFEWATVEDNLRIAGRQGDLSPDKVRLKAEFLLREFELDGYRLHYPAQLSGGTRQRVAIIRQLMCAGHYLVMDEPFSGLDPIMKAKACSLITDVANLDERNTIIVVTHDIAEGLSVADTVWLMGRESGQPGARLVAQYDLAAEDLCWHQDIQLDPRFVKFVLDVKARFKELA